MRVRICGVVALACAIGLSGTAAAATKKPFHETATTCAKYVSPAWVQQETGVVGTPQKGPAGQCHFIVTGTRDAFQISIHAYPTAKQALAFVKQSCTFMGKTSNNPPSPTVTYVSGVGNKACLVDDSGGTNALYAARGTEFVAVQWFDTGSAPITLSHDQSTGLVKALYAKLPK